MQITPLRNNLARSINLKRSSRFQKFANKGSDYSTRNAEKV